MIELVRGVISFHANVLPGMRDQYAQLALGQSPDALMFACLDSRVVPNLFASTDPGRLLVARNAGNLVPPASLRGTQPRGHSEAAAIEIAVDVLKVRDIIVCGHSRCAAMSALLSREPVSPSLQGWIRHGQAARDRLKQGHTLDPSLSLEDQLSQLSVLSQIDNLRTYPGVEQGLATGALRLHGWWFDIASGNVYAFEPEDNRFVIIDENEGARILSRLATP